MTLCCSIFYTAKVMLMSQKTVLELDLVGFSDVARDLQEQMGVEIVASFNDQIQEFVDAALAAIQSKREDHLFDQLNPRHQLDRLMVLIGMPENIRPSSELELYRRQDKIVDWAANSSTGLRQLEKELKALIAKQAPRPHR
jgi:thioesterase domain-containing protein